MANEYFTLMNKARKEGAKSFTYNGKTYVATKTKTGLMIKFTLTQKGKKNINATKYVSYCRSCYAKKRGVEHILLEVLVLLSFILTLIFD
jgi:hypothetical protein